MFGVYFALCAVQEHKDLKILSQVHLHFDDSRKVKYLEYTEHCSKNNQGGLLITPNKQLLLPFKTPRTLIDALLPSMKIVSRRPSMDPKCSTDFYLRPLPKPKSHIWYSMQALSVHNLSKHVKDMCSKAGIVPNGRF